MHNPDAPAELPPWWNDCEAMSFGELREFFDRNLEGAERGALTDDGPHTEEDFVALADLLDSKIEAMRAQLPAEPPRPAAPPGYAPYMSRYFFVASPELRGMQARLEDLEERREEVRYDQRGSSRAEFDGLSRKIGALRQQTRELEAAERKAYPDRYRAHAEADRAHSRNVRRWRAKVDEIQKGRNSLDNRAGFVQRRRQRSESVFKAGPAPSTKGLRWRLLPPGEVTREGLRRHYDELSKKNSGAGYDQDRIEKAMDLGPKELHEEIGATVEGYIVFTFEHTPSVLLECPRVGNAIYVIHHEWERWSQMTKQELMADDSGAVVRIPHQGDWHGKVRRELGID